MNKKFLKHYMETNPEGTAQTYIFLVDNQDIALNIVMSGYQALCLVQEDDGYYFSADSFIEEMRAIQLTGSCQCAYHYVASCTVKWVNDKLLTFFKDAGLDGKAGWQLFKEKEYLGKLDNQKEVEKLLEQYILRFERDPKEEPELSRFHLFDAKGNVKGVRDMEIVDYLVENVQFFVVGITPYYYEHGVFLEDHDGVRMKYRIQKLIYRDQVQSGVIKRIYNLLITQPKVHREAYELNKQPVRWINFKNGYYDPVTCEMLEHNPDYLTINQIPFPYYPEDKEQVLQGGENIKKYLAYHHVYCQDGENLHQWGNSSIRAVLNRNNYYGDLVQRKYESRFQRGEKWCDILDQSQWIITPNAHEPIISRELFDKAQVRLKVAQQKATKTTVGWEEDERAFYNVLYCGDCKRKMCTRRYRGNVYYFCNAAWYRDERKCSHKSISEEKLQKIVRSELTRQFQLSDLRKKDMSAISSAVFLTKIKEIQAEIRKLDADMERRSEKLAQAFMQYKEGELSKEAYIEMKDDRNNWKVFCEERKKSLEQTIRKLEKQQKKEARFLRSLLELDGTTRINAELAESLIESMYLYGDNRLEINFGFKGAVEYE